MISQLIKEQLLSTQADKIKAVSDYKKFLTDNKLTIKNAFSYDLLVDEFKMNQFKSLLQADKSTATKFGMLKDEKAKADFINNTVNLSGWVELDAIKDYIRVIGKGVIVNDYGVYKEQLIEFELDVAAAIDYQLIKWNEHSVVYDKFKKIAEHLTEIEKIYSEYFGKEFDTPFHFLHDLRYSPVVFDYTDTGTIEVSELHLANHHFGEIMRKQWEIKEAEVMRKGKLEMEAKQKAKYATSPKDNE